MVEFSMRHKTNNLCFMEEFMSDNVLCYVIPSINVPVDPMADFSFTVALCLFITMSTKRLEGIYILYRTSASVTHE